MFQVSGGSYQFEMQKIDLKEFDLEGKLFRGTMPYGLGNDEARQTYQNLLEHNSIDKVVVLVTKAELDLAKDEGPDALDFYKSHKIVPVHFPIQDGKIPDDQEKFRALITDLSIGLGSGQNILVHCQGGKGRTGLVISCLIKLLLLNKQVSKGESTNNKMLSDKALKMLRDQVSKAVETKVQLQFLHDFENGLPSIPRRPSFIKDSKSPTPFPYTCA